MTKKTWAYEEGMKADGAVSPAVKTLCKNCRFWSRHDGGEWGSCNNEKVDQSTSDLYTTRQDFGCIHFEKLV